MRTSKHGPVRSPLLRRHHQLMGKSHRQAATNNRALLRHMRSHFHNDLQVAGLRKCRQTLACHRPISQRPAAGSSLINRRLHRLPNPRVVPKLLILRRQRLPYLACRPVRGLHQAITGIRGSFRTLSEAIRFLPDKPSWRRKPWTPAPGSQYRLLRTRRLLPARLPPRRPAAAWNARRLTPSKRMVGFSWAGQNRNWPWSSRATRMGTLNRADVPEKNA